LRTQGSGNLGATNVLRVLGAPAAVATLLLDMAKGTVSVLIAFYLVPVAPYGSVWQQWAMIASTMAVIVGHSYSPYIAMRGGKGVAPAAGALLILTPYAWPILLLTFLLVIALLRMVSLGSIVMAIEYPLLCLWLYPGEWPIIVFSFAAAALVLWRHRSNMGRIARREEPRVSFKRGKSAARSEDGS
jgi:glycerol-3-phosphate acyltransferase PlsY